MTWAKSDVRWYEADWTDRMGDEVSRAEALAAWSIVQAYAVEHATGGAIQSRRVERLLGYVLEVEPARARTVCSVLVAAGAWTCDGDHYRFVGWDQPDLGANREHAAARQRRRRTSSEAVSDDVGVSRVTERDMSRVTGTQASRVTGDDVSRLQIRSDQKRSRSEKSRPEQKHAPTERVLPAPAREASPALPTVAKADTTPAASCVGGSTEGLSEDTRKILAELQRHPKLVPIASPELASVIDGRRIGSGTSIADVARAIGDAVAHADEGIASASLRRMVVGYCDHAHARHRGRPKVAPAQSEVPIERSWRPNQGREEGWAVRTFTPEEKAHFDSVFGPDPAVKAGAA